MKFFIVLLCLGLASANVYEDAIKQVLEKSVHELQDALKSIPLPAEDAETVAVADETRNQLTESLRQSMDGPLEKVMEAKALLEKIHRAKDAETAAIADETRNQLTESLKQSMDGLLEKVKERVTDHQNNAQDLVEKAKALLEKIHDAHGKVSEKSNDLAESLKDRATGALKNFMEKIREAFRKQEAEDKSLVYSMESTAIVGEEAKDVAQKMKDLMEHLTGRLQDRFQGFRAWAKENFEKVMAHAKDKHAQVMDIAKEAIKDAHSMRKDTMRQVVEILRPHKEELGNTWNELLEQAKNVINKPKEQ